MKKGQMVKATLLCRKMGERGHIAYYLSGSINGYSRHRYIRKKEVEKWKIRAKNWRRFKEAIVKWVKLNKKIEGNLRKIGVLECLDMPMGKKRKDKKGGKKNYGE